MKRLWAKIYKDNRLIQDMTAHITDGEWEYDVVEESMDAFHEICNELDIEHPMWLEANKEEFKKREKTSFSHNNFIEEPKFDMMEIDVIETR
ncbi:MAG: hypothetical protein KBS66_02180 [Eubacterium sp.]|nr:hypothetical protein [Candidatus Colimonas fimequi]